MIDAIDPVVALPLAAALWALLLARPIRIYLKDRR